MRHLPSKFSSLQKLRSRQQFKHLVPPFYYVPLVRAARAEKNLIWFKKLFNHHTTYILRSSLKNESSHTLLPGQSVSIQNIQSFQTFAKAYQKIRGQKNIDCIVLQEQKFIDHHLTSLFFNNIAFVENTDQEKQFFYLNQYSQLGGGESLPQPVLRQIYHQLRKISSHLKHDFFLAELGVCDDSLFVFQLMPLANTKLANTSLANAQLASTHLANTNLANTNLANKNLTSTQMTNTKLARTNLANISLTSGDLIQSLMLKYEEALHAEVAKEKTDLLSELAWLWRAFKLRRTFEKQPQLFKKQNTCYEYVVSNWRALINCYRVYSWWHPQASFFEFYTWAMAASTRWAKWARQHFVIATHLAKGAFVSPEFMQNYEKMIFLGHQNKVCTLQNAATDTDADTNTDAAINTAAIGQPRRPCKAYLLDDLNPRDIYALPDGSVILTSSSNLLSHGYLAAIERNLQLVGNIPAPLWRQLKSSTQIQVQFKTKKIVLLDDTASSNHTLDTVAA